MNCPKYWSAFREYQNLRSLEIDELRRTENIQRISQLQTRVNTIQTEINRSNQDLEIDRQELEVLKENNLKRERYQQILFILWLSFSLTVSYFVEHNKHKIRKTKKRKIGFCE